mmetsp:Transcript_20038/g.57992  ORF Transcript_20038/g.57992 Transcript_20038/m.57992 type:complete len:303 (-) Transcript_20038:68-976(-)
MLLCIEHCPHLLRSLLICGHHIIHLIRINMLVVVLLTLQHVHVNGKAQIRLVPPRLPSLHFVPHRDDAALALPELLLQLGPDLLQRLLHEVHGEDGALLRHPVPQLPAPLLVEQIGAHELDVVRTGVTPRQSIVRLLHNVRVDVDPHGPLHAVRRIDGVEAHPPVPAPQLVMDVAGTGLGDVQRPPRHDVRDGHPRRKARHLQVFVHGHVLPRGRLGSERLGNGGSADQFARFLRQFLLRFLRGQFGVVRPDGDVLGRVRRRVARAASASRGRCGRGRGEGTDGTSVARGGGRRFESDPPMI